MEKILAKLVSLSDYYLEIYHRRVVQPLSCFNSWQNWLSFSAILFFVIWVNICLVIMAVFSRNWFLELFKWSQFFCLVLLVYLLLSLINRKLSLLVVGIVIFFYGLLITYFARTYTHLTYVFITRNVADIESVKSYLAWPLVLVVLASFSAVLALHKFSRPLWRQKTARWFIILLAASGFFLPFDWRNELVVFAQTAYNHSPIVEQYQTFYQQLLKTSAQNKAANLSEWQKIATQPVPSYLDNIIFLHLESFNGQLVSASITPNFYDLATSSYYFPRFYANNIQTIYGQENILCSMPGSFSPILVESGEDKNILCLPQMLRTAGYRTFFAKAGELSFAQTGKFMTNIGFSETHSADLMQPGDPKYVMGYREDVFYARVFDYLQAHPAPRNLIYIAVSGTSHWPFELPKDITPAQTAGLPYSQPKNFEERFSNNSYLQDSYLKIALQRIDQLYPAHNYTLLVVGDHSWPLGRHPNNVFIGADCYEENFTTALAVRVGQESIYQQRVASSPYSQMDIIPSLAQLFGVNYATSTYERSFFATSTGADNKIISVQPLANQCLNIIKVKDNQKLRYNLINNRAAVFDLNRDPQEQWPRELPSNSSTTSVELETFLNFTATTTVEKITN